MFEEEIVWISRTVLLETVWVLSSVYGLADIEIAQTIEGLLGLEAVRVEAGDDIKLALTWAAEGMDLADGIHVTGGSFGPEVGIEPGGVSSKEYELCVDFANSFVEDLEV